MVVTKKEAIEWAEHFPTNENLWYVVCPHNDGYVVYSNTHFKFYPTKKIIYSTRDKK